MVLLQILCALGWSCAESEGLSSLIVSSTELSNSREAIFSKCSVRNTQTANEAERIRSSVSSTLCSVLSFGLDCFLVVVLVADLCRVRRARYAKLYKVASRCAIRHSLYNHHALQLLQTFELAGNCIHNGSRSDPYRVYCAGQCN
jgi:hypothetical protein